MKLIESPFDDLSYINPAQFLRFELEERWRGAGPDDREYFVVGILADRTVVRLSPPSKDLPLVQKQLNVFINWLLAEDISVSVWTNSRWTKE